jgi:hypothetical protein
MHSKGASPDTTFNIGVREGRAYRLQDKHVRGSKEVLGHGLMTMAKDEEQEAPKGEQSKDEQNS